MRGGANKYSRLASEGEAQRAGTLQLMIVSEAAAQAVVHYAGCDEKYAAHYIYRYFSRMTADVVGKETAKDNQGKPKGHSSEHAFFTVLEITGNYG